MSKRELWTLSYLTDVGDLTWETIEGRDELDKRLAEIDDPDSVCLCEGPRIPFAKVTRVQLGSVDAAVTVNKPKRTRRTKAQMAEARAAEGKAKANGHASEVQQ